MWGTWITNITLCLRSSSSSSSRLPSVGSCFFLLSSLSVSLFAFKCCHIISAMIGEIIFIIQVAKDATSNEIALEQEPGFSTADNRYGSLLTELASLLSASICIVCMFPWPTFSKSSLNFIRCC